MDKKRITVYLGTGEYRMLVTDDEAHVNALADDVNAHIKAVHDSYPTLSDYDCAMLAMLNMSQELSDINARYSELESRIETLRDIPVMPVKRPLEKKRTPARTAAEEGVPVGTK
ncbi:MAG: cell division protein ZapA [Clostridia bacterium]|nr:cell division protein ZapA [Clostridia bacterium]